MSETRAEILETATDILVTEGYEALTTQRLADELDVTEAGVYYHFDSKDDLLVAMVEHLEAKFEDVLSSIEGTPDERLAAILQDRFEAVEAVRELEVLPPSVQLLTATTSNDDPLRQALLSFAESYITLLTETIREGVERGVFETERPEETARTLAALIQGAEILATLDQSSEPSVWGTARYVLSDLYVGEPPELEVPA